MITVWCVLWGNKYSPEYVYRLQHQVKKQLSVRHQFICITAQELNGVFCYEPPCDFPGWWQKIGLFKPGVAQAEHINMYLDLDVVIVGELDSLVNAYGDADLAAPRDWSKGTMASPFMIWNPCHRTDYIWQAFDESVMERKAPGGKQYGDQNYINSIATAWFVEISPPLICSYKWHCRAQGGPPQHARVVCFHGKPDPHEVEADWIADAWS
jgi:hypothetical protein